MKKHLWKKRIGNIVVRMRRVMATPRAEATKPKQTVIFLFFFFSLFIFIITATWKWILILRTWERSN